MRRLRPVYEGDAAGAPAKPDRQGLTRWTPSSRQVGEILRFYQKGDRASAPISPTAPPCARARAYGVDYDPASMDFVLLLEDMSPARMPDQVEGLTLEEAGRAIDAAAGLHGAWWRSPELPATGWLLT
jgi:hypothetical protein